MVTIIGCIQRQNKAEKSFVALELQGDIELVQSLETGNFYATARRTSITCTFSEETAKGLIGTKLPGTIKRVESEPYEYIVPETGEAINLAHKYEYQPDIAPYSPAPSPQFNLNRLSMPV